MKKTREITSQEEIITCDVCCDQINLRSSINRIKVCRICNKDVCSTCAILTEYDFLRKGVFYGDYPDFYCPTCWSAGEEERNKILDIREQAEKDEDILWKQWKTKCKK